MANTSANGTAAPRCAALIGPYLSGKTSLLEALLFASGATTRRGSVRDGNSVGDHAPGGAGAADVDRAQRRGRVVSRRSVDDPRLPRLGRARLRGAGRDAGRRRRGRRRRARGRARADDQPAAALSRPAQNPAHDLHQQDGQRERPGAGRAGGVAVSLAAPAGAAPGAAARGRGRSHRLCRFGQRARLSLSPGPGIRSDPAPRRLLGPGAGDPQRAH